MFNDRSHSRSVCGVYNFTSMATKMADAVGIGIMCIREAR